MASEIWVSLIVNISGIILVLIKLVADGGKRRVDRDTLNSTLTTMGGDIKEVKEKVQTLENSDIFKHSLQESIRQRSTQIISFSTLTDTYKNILSAWARHLEDLAFKFYYSKARGSEDDLERYLNIESPGKLTSLENYQNSLVPNPKNFKGAPTTLTEYLQTNSKVYSSWGLLIERLIENGIAEDELITIFEKFVTKILEANIDGFIAWEQLLEY